MTSSNASIDANTTFLPVPGVALRDLQATDMESLRRWRNAQTDILRHPAPLSVEDQQAYWTDVIQPMLAQPLHQRSQVLWAYTENGALIGYGGLTYIDWAAKRSELAFLLDPALNEPTERFQRYWSSFLALVLPKAFDELGLNRVFTETYDHRPYSYPVLESHGFRCEGRLKDHRWIAALGRTVDSVFYGCLASDVHPSQRAS